MTSEGWLALCCIMRSLVNNLCLSVLARKMKQPRWCARILFIYDLFIKKILSLLQFQSLLNQHFLRPQKQEACVTYLRGGIDAVVHHKCARLWIACAPVEDKRHSHSSCFACLRFVFGSSMECSASCNMSCVRFGCLISLSLPQTPNRGVRIS